MAAIGLRFQAALKCDGALMASMTSSTEISSEGRGKGKAAPGSPCGTDETRAAQTLERSSPETTRGCLPPAPACRASPTSPNGTPSQAISPSIPYSQARVICIGINRPPVWLPEPLAGFSEANRIADKICPVRSDRRESGGGTPQNRVPTPPFWIQGGMIQSVVGGRDFRRCRAQPTISSATVARFAELQQLRRDAESPQYSRFRPEDWRAVLARRSRRVVRTIPT